MAILSIQSHVAYGYVGNKASVYPLQSMGYDVWPVNTVQFSSHTGYPTWRGDVFSREHIRSIINGLEAMELEPQCQAILSGYMGSEAIAQEVYDTVARFKQKNNKMIYLCDPVIGNSSCFVKPEVLEFFKKHLKADIITPNMYEAQILSNIEISNLADLKRAAAHLHEFAEIVIITGVKFGADYSVFVSDGKYQYLVAAREYKFAIPINGTGDLFSAVFLGTYLATESALEAAKNAVYYMDLVVGKSFAAKSQELQVIATRYDIENRIIKTTEL